MVQEPGTSVNVPSYCTVYLSNFTNVSPGMYMKPCDSQNF